MDEFVRHRVKVVVIDTAMCPLLRVQEIKLLMETTGSAQHSVSAVGLRSILSSRAQPEKPFRCAHCHYSCNISGSLKRHYNRKHPNEEYANVGSVELAAEALIQQGGLKCPVCSFVYGTKWEFNRHMKNKHGLKVVEIDGDPKGEAATETPEEPSTQYLYITEAEEDAQGTQAAVAALQDLRYTSESGDRLDPTAVNILQQIIELGSETHDATAVASVVAMAPGTVTVVKQVTDEEPSSNHTVMIQETLQQASVELAEQHHLVVSSDDVEGIETVTVYTQGGEASEFIVYVQEAVQPVEEQSICDVLRIVSVESEPETEVQDPQN
ncbi:zinc finger protein [Cricetulus griseus]|nr:zinc finger protein [Cricetulus griseus]